MTAITYGAAVPAANAASAKPAVSVKSIWSRLWDAFVEARMRQAMREIAVYRHLLPAELEVSLNRGSAKINP